MRRYLAFFGVALALDVAPGPDILFVMAQSLAHGASAGVYVTLGLCSGLCVHVTLAALGFADVMKRMPALFMAVTWAGAAYLAYLGVEAWRAAAVVAVDGGGAPAADVLPPLRLYLRGIVMNLCNPKVMLFFLALVPRFIDRERGHEALQFVLLGGLFAISTALVFCAVSAGGGLLANAFADTPAAGPVLQRLSALVRFGLAGWIAWMNLRTPQRDTSAGRPRQVSGTQ